MTQNIEITAEWQEVTTSECLIQERTNNGIFIAASDTEPDDTENCFYMNDSSIKHFPPLDSGSYWAKCPNLRVGAVAKIVVMEL